MRTAKRHRIADVRARRGVAIWLLLAAPTVLFLGGALYLSWLLWRYVPPHAALFEGLGISLPTDARIAIVASNWFVRVLPFVVLLGLGLARLVLMPLVAHAFDGDHRWAMGVVVAILSVLGVATLGSSAVVLHGIHTACSQASADPRFREEQSGIARAGESACSTTAYR